MRLKSTPPPSVPLEQPHPLTAGVVAYRFAHPPTAETKEGGTEGGGVAAAWEEGRSLSDPWSGGGGWKRAGARLLSPAPRTSGLKQLLLLAYNGGDAVRWKTETARE